MRQALLALLALAAVGIGVAGCSHTEKVYYNDDHGYRHEGWYDDHHDWHGGYYDEHHAWHDDARDWHN